MEIGLFSNGERQNQIGTRDDLTMDDTRCGFSCLKLRRGWRI